MYSQCHAGLWPYGADPKVAHHCKSSDPGRSECGTATGDRNALLLGTRGKVNTVTATGSSCGEQLEAKRPVTLMTMYHY